MSLAGVLHAGLFRFLAITICSSLALFVSACIDTDQPYRLSANEPDLALVAWKNHLTAEKQGIVKKRVSDAKVRAALEGIGSEVLEQAGLKDKQKLSIHSLYSQGLQNNPDIKLAWASKDLADKRYVNAVLAHFPQLSATYSVLRTRQNIISSDNQVFASGTARYPTERAGVNASLPVLSLENLFSHRAALLGTKIAWLGYLDSIQDYVYRLATAYIEAGQAHYLEQNYRSSIALRKRQIALERKLATVEGGSPEKLLELQKVLLEDEVNAKINNGIYKSRLEKIGRLVGKRVYALKLDNGPLIGKLALGQKDMDALMRIALRGNIGLRSLEYQAQMQREKTKAAYAQDFAPKITLDASYSYQDQEGSQFGGGSETENYQSAVNVRMPVFNDGGKGYAGPEADATYYVTLAKISQKAGDIKEALGANLLGYQISISQLASARGARKRAMAMSGVLKRKLDAEEISPIDYYQSRIDGLEVDRLILNAKTAVAKSWLGVKNATGAIDENVLRQLY